MKTHNTTSKTKTAKRPRSLGAPKKAPLGERMKEQMLRILLRGRGETLGEACKAVGITPTTFYYRLRKATFGAGRRGRTPKVSLTAIDAKRLSTLIRRQEHLQAALNEFSRKVL